MHYRHLKWPNFYKRKHHETTAPPLLWVQLLSQLIVGGEMFLTLWIIFTFRIKLVSKWGVAWIGMQTSNCKIQNSLNGHVPKNDMFVPQMFPFCHIQLKCLRPWS